MKKTKFSEQQIAFILRQAKDGATVGEVGRKAGISEATFYNWGKKYAGLMPSEMKRGNPTALKQRIKEIAETRVRYGYRRIHVLLQRGRMTCQCKACLPALSRDGPAIAEQIS